MGGGRELEKNINRRLEYAFEINPIILHSKHVYIYNTNSDSMRIFKSLVSRYVAVTAFLDTESGGGEVYNRPVINIVNFQ